MAWHDRGGRFGLLQSLGFVAIVCTCVHAESPKETYLNRLAEREARIRDMSGQYERRSKISEPGARRQLEFAKRLASEKTAKKRRLRNPPATIEEAIERSRANTICTYMLRNDNGLRERRLDREMHRADPDFPFSAERIAFDGEHSYEVDDSTVNLKGGSSTVRVDKGDVKMLFDMDCEMAILMGLCLPHGNNTLSAIASRSDAEFSDPIVKDGMHLVELRFTVPSDGKSLAIGVQALLDLDHDLAIRELNEVMVPPRTLAKYPDLKTAPGFRHHWEVPELAQEPTTKIWYPRKARNGSVSATGEYRTDIRDSTYEPPTFNQGLSGSDFTPRLVAGDLIFDDIHRAARVYPGTLPEQIATAVKKTAASARRTLANASSGAPPKPAMPGEHLFQGIILGAIAVVVLGTTVIVWHRARGRKED